MLLVGWGIEKILEEAIRDGSGGWGQLIKVGWILLWASAWTRTLIQHETLPTTASDFVFKELDAVCKF